MDTELKAKWVAALRGGEYQQARYQLRNGNGHCCLGVLCEVAGLKIDRMGERVEGVEAQNAYKPVTDLIGEEYQTDHLTRLNDSERKSFAEIADYIETNF